jgi:arabinose-5-phosphate isomerase
MNYTNIFTQVLKDEAKAIEDAASRVDEATVNSLIKVYEFLHQSGGSLVISGVGKSGHIGTKLAATFASLALPSIFLHPTEAMHGDLGRLTKRDALVIISKSGTTEELLSMMPYVTVPKERIIAIIGKLGSPLANKSGIVLDASVDREACINNLAPTTSTTVALAVGDAMAIVYEHLVKLTKDQFGMNHPAGLLGKALSLTVDRLLTPANQCPVVQETATLQEAIIAMTKNPVGLCAVVDNGKLLGVLAEEDISKAFAQSQTAITSQVKTLLNANPVTLEEKTLARDALKTMETEEKVLSVVAVVNEGKFLGVLRLQDLFKAGFNSLLKK